MENKKKKIVIISLVYEPFWSGAEKMVKEIAERMYEKYEITIITSRLDNNLKKEERVKGYKIVRVGRPCKPGIFDKLMFPFLSAFAAKKEQPDLAHAIMESYAAGALILLSLIYPKAKRMLTLQSGDLDDQRKQKQFLIKVLWKKIHRTPHVITAISTALAKRAENLGVKKENIYITPNGIDFSRVPKGVETVSNRVVCVGRLSWEKSHKLILKAWPEVIAAVPDAKLVFVGEGPEREPLEKQIEELNIASSVTLTGNLEHQKALEALTMSEIFICPSLAEGLGNVFIEAQACGVPPIGTRVGGIPDVIQHEDNGLLIASDNYEEIRDALIRLLKDKDLISKLRERGRETARKFEWEKICNKINNIYESILK